MFIKKIAFLCFVFALGGFVFESQAQTSTVFAVGLEHPQKIIYAHQYKFFLVSEAGSSTPNSGRVSIVTESGARVTLIDGLPSGLAQPNNDPSGPSALLLQGNKLYIAIGNGNATIAGAGQGSEIPNPNPNSPIFSSVLELTLPSVVLKIIPKNFSLSSADHARLANGETLILPQPFGLFPARIRLAADFPNFTPLPRPDVPNNVRPSNPFGLALHANTLYVADAAQNNIRTVDLGSGAIGTLITYPPRPNPLPFGPPVTDPVPDSLRLFNNKLLVTFLVGFPFPAGAADVRQYDLDTGAESQLIGGLTSAIDVLPVDEGGFCSTAYTLEFSTNMLAGAPGRLQRFDAPTAMPTVISNTLISPTSLARHPQTGDLFVTEIFTGRIMRITLP